MPSPNRLRLSSEALVSNWRWLAERGGAAACGAAVKADGYGLGAVEVAAKLASSGCRDFYVSTWGEALALGRLPDGCSLSILHGIRLEDMETASRTPHRPVLNTLRQVELWRPKGRACDVMVDTGMNRLGLSISDVASGALKGLVINTLMSHLVSADEDSTQTAHQLSAFQSLIGQTSAKRMSLANSAGICLGRDYAFDLTRPGLALYGGVPRSEAAGHILQVAFPEVQVIQRRAIKAGDKVGYNATFTADRAMELAILNLGYADGYLRGFSNRGSAGEGAFPVIGRVSMDLVAIDVSTAPELREGDWVGMDYDLLSASAQSGLSQYELLTGLGERFDRTWSA